MAISVLQQAQNSASATGTTITKALTGATTSGSYIYVAAANFGSNSNTISVSDSVNGAYNGPVNTINIHAGSGQIQQWWVYNPTGTAAPTITVTYSPTSTYRAVAIAEIGGSAGPDTSGTYFNGSYQANPAASANSITTGNLVPSVANGLCIGAVTNWAVNNAGITAGSGFTDISGATFWQYGAGSNNGDFEYSIYSSTSPLAATWTPATTGWDSACVAMLFKPSTGGGGPFAIVQTGSAYNAFVGSAVAVTPGATPAVGDEYDVTMFMSQSNYQTISTVTDNNSNVYTLIATALYANTVYITTWRTTIANNATTPFTTTFTLSGAPTSTSATLAYVELSGVLGLDGFGGAAGTGSVTSLTVTATNNASNNDIAFALIGFTTNGAISGISLPPGGFASATTFVSGTHGFYGVYLPISSPQTMAAAWTWISINGVAGIVYSVYGSLINLPIPPGPKQTFVINNYLQY